MPESPEVQALVEFVGERAVGRGIREFEVIDYPEYKTRVVPPTVLDGSPINAVNRFGKYVDIDTGERQLVISFGRGGWFVWHDDMRHTEGDPVPESQVGAPVVARLTLDDGSGVDVTDAGGFRSVGLWIVENAKEVPGVAALGPDPADPSFSRDDFDRAFAGRRKQIKAILQEQKSLAGIGNAYSDEILFAARANPVQHASELAPADLDRLYEHTVQVVRAAIHARRGVPIAELKATKIEAMLVHGRAGEPCPGCDGTVRDFTFGSTTAQYCPECQTGGVIL